MLKIWRSPYSRFGIHVEYPDDLQDETVTAEKSYTAGSMQSGFMDSFIISFQIRIFRSLRRMAGFI